MASSGTYARAESNSGHYLAGGATLKDGASVDDWAIAAGLDWEAISRPVNFTAEDGGEMLTMAKQNVLMRSDTNAPLGIVSDRYKPVQPRELLDFFEKVTEHVGDFKIDAAGSLSGGKRVWAIAHSTHEPSAFAKGERIQRNLLMASSFDFSMPTIVRQTSLRLACTNQLASQLGRQDGALRISHISHFDFDTVKEKMALDENWEGFMAKIDLMASKQISERRARELFLDVLYPAVEDEKEITARQHKRVDELVGIMHNAPGQETKAAKGTVWGALNAVTWHADHNMRGKDPERAFDRASFGEGHSMKMKAAKLALAFAE